MFWLSSPLGVLSNSIGGVDDSMRESVSAVSEPDFSEGFCMGCENPQSVEVRGYANWEESLVKFSEFLGFLTVGHGRGIN